MSVSIILQVLGHGSNLRMTKVKDLRVDHDQYLRREVCFRLVSVGIQIPVLLDLRRFLAVAPSHKHNWVVYKLAEE